MGIDPSSRPRGRGLSWVGLGSTGLTLAWDSTAFLNWVYTSGSLGKGQGGNNVDIIWSFWLAVFTVGGPPRAVLRDQTKPCVFEVPSSRKPLMKCIYSNRDQVPFWFHALHFEPFWSILTKNKLVWNLKSWLPAGNKRYLVLANCDDISGRAILQFGEEAERKQKQEQVINAIGHFAATVYLSCALCNTLCWWRILDYKGLHSKLVQMRAGLIDGTKVQGILNRSSSRTRSLLVEKLR